MAKKVLIVCSLGMSTSLLINEIKKYTESSEYSIKCSDVTNAMVLIPKYDMILLAPHIKFLDKQFKDKCELYNKVYMMIDEKDYRDRNGLEILKKIKMSFYEYEKNQRFRVILLHHNGMMSDLIYFDMKQKLKARNLDWNVKSISLEEYYNQPFFADVILLEPQVRYEQMRIKKKVDTSKTTILSPPWEVYSSFNGDIMIGYIEKYMKEKGKMNETYYESR